MDGGEDNGDDGCNSFLLVSKFAFWTNPCTQQLLCIKGFIWPHNHLFKKKLTKSTAILLSSFSDFNVQF